MNPITRIYDSLSNLMSGLGTAGDKTTHSKYYFTPTSYEQLESAYRGDWIARKIVDIPAQDSTREWREWMGEPEHIQRIEELEKELEIKKRVAEAIIQARLYGGCVLYMGLPGDPDQPLMNVPQGGLEFVRVIPKRELGNYELVYDIASEYYGEPEWYNLTSRGQTINIHASRVVRFIGRKIPTITEDVWGDSVLESVLDAIRRAASVIQAAGVLVEEAKIDIIKIPEFLRGVETKQYRDNIIQRFQLANQGKSVVNALLLDKEDEHSRISANFSGIPDMLKLYLLISSGAADIPATRMLGQSPTGLSATGESDLRNYYDSVGATQRNELQPALKNLDNALVMSALGQWPERLEYEWRPLWQMSALERVQRDLTQAQAFQVDGALGLFDDEVLTRARLAQLEMSGAYPGITQLFEEYQTDPAEELPEDDPNVLSQFGNLNPGEPEPDPNNPGEPGAEPPPGMTE